MNIQKIIDARFDRDKEKALNAVEKALLDAWIVATCAPSNDDEEIIEAMIEFAKVYKKGH
jgi:hypothetical protein